MLLDDPGIRVNVCLILRSQFSYSRILYRNHCVVHDSARKGWIMSQSVGELIYAWSSPLFFFALCSPSSIPTTDRPYSSYRMPAATGSVTGRWRESGRVTTNDIRARAFARSARSAKQRASQSSSHSRTVASASSSSSRSASRSSLISKPRSRSSGGANRLAEDNNGR